MKTRFVDIDDRMEDLADRMRAAPAVGEEFLNRYELSWLYHENALEGVVYTSQELATALANMPLADARTAALKARARIREGHDPLGEQLARRASLAADGLVFAACGLAC